MWEYTKFGCIFERIVPKEWWQGSLGDTEESKVYCQVFFPGGNIVVKSQQKLY